MWFFGKKTEEINSVNQEKKSTRKRFIMGMLLTVVFLWVIVSFIGFFMPSSTSRQVEKNGLINDNTLDLSPPSTLLTENEPDSPSVDAEAKNAPAEPLESEQKSEAQTSAYGKRDENPSETPETLPVPNQNNDGLDAETAPPPVSPPPSRPPPPRDRQPGIAFTEAVIAPIEYELTGRFWGWRVNDLIQITDNVQNYQLGVLEVTRRSIVALAERMSRTGSAASYVPELEDAMNWIMVKADAFWFPSAESKYKESIRDLRAYKDKLERGTASFYTRTDNLIPLLASFEDLLGSCDENLLKMREADGSKVSFFKADDYFYYTKGVIESMLTILEALREDYYTTLDNRRSVEIIDHAIYNLERGKEIKPWIVLNSSLSSVLSQPSLEFGRSCGSSAVSPGVADQIAFHMITRKQPD